MAASAVQYDVASRSIPVLLLKTKSSPGDAYEELFLSTPASNDFVFKPRFLPVLEHRFKKEGLARIGELLQRRQIGRGEGCLYGGLVFTSQRAVEAFAEAVEQGRGASHIHHCHMSTGMTTRLNFKYEQAMGDGLTYKTCPFTASGLQLPER
jgi:uroporphyrinogen-III synthase